jgi:N-acetylneuraminic acid mutarotase
MRKLLCALLVVFVAAGSALAQDIPLLVKYPTYVQGGAAPGTGVPFIAQIALKPSLADTAYFRKPRLSTSSYRQYFWVDSTSESTSYRNTWQNDLFMWLRSPVFRPANAVDTLRFWVAAKCLGPRNEREGIRAYFRLKGTATNIISPSPDSVTVLSMLRDTGTGGWLAGHVYQPGTGARLQNHVVLAFSGGQIVGSCASEDNRTDEGYPIDPGYFYMACRAGSIDSLAVYRRDEFFNPTPESTQIRPTWTVTAGCTTWVDLPATGPQIAGYLRTPTWPFSSETVAVQARIVSVGGTVIRDSLRYAVNDTAIWNWLPHDSYRSSDSTYFFHVPPLDTGAKVFCQLSAVDSATGQRTTTPLDTYRIPYDHSISQIQYTTNPAGTSPDSGKYVRTTGIVNGLMVGQQRAYISDAAGGPWSGILVFRRLDTLQWRISLGDSIDVAGKVKEFNRVTEFDSLRRVGIRANIRPYDTTLVTVTQAGTETYEGVLLRLDTVRVLRDTGAFVGNRTYFVANLAGDSIQVYVTNNTPVVGTRIPDGWFSLVANGGQYQTTYQLMPRYPSDFIPIVPDVGAIEVLAPRDTMSNGDTVTPRAVFRNFGSLNTARNVPVRFRIGAFYNVARTIASLAPGGADTVEFDLWTAIPGTHTLKAYTELAGDPNRADDTVFGSVRIGNVDLAVTAVTSPAAVVETAQVVIPSARVSNRGEFPASFPAYFSIDSGLDSLIYQESLAVTGLAAGAETLLVFTEWPKPHAIGNYQARCSTFLTGDIQPGNDVLNRPFEVIGQPAETGWVRKPDLPMGSRDKKVKDGGCLAASDALAESETTLVFALKGNGRCEFYSYNCASNAWLTRESIPAVGSAGKKKAVKKGASIAYASGLLFAAKGNSTVEWWQYNPALSGTPTYPWIQKTDIPAAAKLVKEGTGAASVTKGETTFVYFLRGSGGQEFLRYNPLTNAWATMAPAPLGTSGKPFKDGSCLAVAEDGSTVFALKGSYNELFAYDVATNTWSSKASLPLTGSGGRKKKVKSGAGIACHASTVYAMKGGGTYEFWQYRADSGTGAWTQGPDVPAGTGRPVKGGGALTYAAQPNALFGFKGNNTLDFFKYGFSLFSGAAPAVLSPQAQSGTALSGPRPLLSVTPNPFSSTALVHYVLPKATSYRLRLYDVSGHLVGTLASGHGQAGAASLTVRRPALQPGVYLLRLETTATLATVKLIAE